MARVTSFSILNICRQGEGDGEGEGEGEDGEGEDFQHLEHLSPG